LLTINRKYAIELSDSEATPPPMTPAKKPESVPKKSILSRSRYDYNDGDNEEEEEEEEEDLDEPETGRQSQVDEGRRMSPTGQFKPKSAPLFPFSDPVSGATKTPETPPKGKQPSIDSGRRRASTRPSMTPNVTTQQSSFSFRDPGSALQLEASEGRSSAR
jgi:hypothetical protein